MNYDLSSFDYKNCKYQDAFIEKSVSEEIKQSQYTDENRPKKRGRKKGIKSKKKYEAHPKEIIKFLDKNFPLIGFENNKRDIIYSIRRIEENLLEQPKRRGRKRKVRSVDKKYKTNIRQMLNYAFDYGLFKDINKENFIDKAEKLWEYSFEKIYDPYVFDIIKINDGTFYLDNNGYIYDEDRKLLGLKCGEEYLSFGEDPKKFCL